MSAAEDPLAVAGSQAMAASQGSAVTDLADSDQADPTADVTRQRLVASAGAVFSERGYDGAGVQEIARRAGLTTGAIYGRFSGKAELLREAIEQASNNELDELFNQHQFRGHASEIIRMAGAHLVDRPDEDAHQGNALLLEAFVASRRDSEILDAVRGVMETRAARLAEVLDAAKDDGSLDPSLDTDSLVAFCHALGLGFLLFDAIEMDLPKAEPWDALIGRLVTELSRGSSTTATSTTKEQQSNHQSKPTSQGD